MKKKNGLQSLRMAPRAAGFALATILPLAVSTASAFELNLGAVTGSLDTTLSYGTGWRLEDQDKNLAAQFSSYNAPGDTNSAVANNRRTFINKNDGDANFDNDHKPITSAFKITSDLELKSGDFGAFVRGTAFYDTVLADEFPNRSAPVSSPNPASCNAQTTANVNDCGFPAELDEKVSSDARFLDAYVYGNFTVADRALNVRLGEQVINWGEALFLQEGINNANPVSLSKLRLPGAEVREALLPLPMIYASYELAEGLSMEAFFEFDWDYSEADGVGSYYSTDDAFAGDGANQILVNMQGSALQNAALFYNGANARPASTVLTIDRTTDLSVDAGGQYGVAFRYNSENTEYGLFFVNYHSHKQVAQAITGEANGYQNGNQSAQNGVNACVAGGGLLASCIIGVNAAHYIDTTRYQFVYPEDIQMVGLSFSTTVGDLSVSGELAYRPNDVILAELGDNLVAYNTLNAAVIGNGGSATAGSVLNDGKAFSASTIVRDWVELESYNFDLVTINNFGPLLGADGVVGVLEMGGAYLPEGEDKRYASTAALLNLEAPYNASVPAEGPSDDYLDEFSWGYRAVLSATYNDVFAGVALNPVLRFAHDVDGNSHRSGNFLENRKSGTLGVNSIYNNALEVGVAYNAFWGAEASNLLGDRDNLTLTLKYSF